MKVNYSVEEILDGIKTRNNIVLVYVYENYFLQIKNYILKNCGDEDDARDIFQEALIVIFKKVNKDVLVLTCSFQAYLFSVSRLLWLKQLENRRIKTEEKLGDQSLVELADDLNEISRENEKYDLYRFHFERLSIECKEILTMFLEKVPLKTIADQLGLKTEKYTKKRKYQCKEKLIENIRNDIRFRQL
ncbi:MAG: sigma-70 family RNA polymerase sigma factor [Bacteroidia bacterium]|nr:sigma-70 family RNA polymerase sigma factor [Bacteroidia bacterium]